jgi:hypothetical protein
MNYILQSLALILVNAAFACILHEAAHVAVASLFRIKVKNVGVSWLGFYTVREEAPPFDNMIVALAGPLANLVFAFLLLIPNMSGEAWNLFLANLVIGGFNLLPFEKSDGTRAAECWRRIESAKDDLATQIHYGARSCGKTDMQIQDMLKWQEKNPTGILQLWSFSQESAKSMYERIKLAGGDISRVRINVDEKSQNHLSTDPLALHNRAS